MSLQSIAQEAVPQLIVIDPSMVHPMGGDMSPDSIEVSEEPHMGDHMGHMDEHASPMEVSEPVEVEIVVGDLPGAPAGTIDPQPLIEVSDDKDDKHDAAEAEDDNKSKKKEKWDWESKGSHGFIPWIKERIDDVPKHSGYDSAGLERAVAYLERLDNEISRAMRMDVDGELDANKIEEVRSKIDNGLTRLHDRLDKVKSSKKKNRKKKSEFEHSGLVKEAQKITGVQGIFVTVDLLTSRIARVCINGMVSGGHDIEDIYARQVKEYDLNKREQAQVIQLLEDMGYAVRQDRGYMPDEEVDIASSDNMDWAANYKG